jgi:hypothetical protein
VASALGDPERRELALGLSRALLLEVAPNQELLMRCFALAALPERAAQHAVCAAEASFAALAFDRASQLYAYALEHGRFDASEANALRVRKAESLAAAGHGERAGEAYLLAARAETGESARQLMRKAGEYFLMGGAMALANDRLSLRADGRVELALKTPWADGTTHIAYQPLDFLAKLAALIPRPRKNLVLYHGVLAARSKWRARVVGYRRAAETDNQVSTPTSREARGAWAELMRRAFGYDLLACERCGGKMVFLSCILRRDVIARILARAGPAR